MRLVVAARLRLVESSYEYALVFVFDDIPGCGPPQTLMVFDPEFDAVADSVSRQFDVVGFQSRLHESLYSQKLLTI
jgi:hypothetical protein